MSTFTESVVEDAALAWLEGAGWTLVHGADIAPGELGAERVDFGEVLLAQRLRDALVRLNPALPADAIEDAFRRLSRPEGAELIQRNRALHRLLVDGVNVEYRTADGSIRGAQRGWSISTSRRTTTGWRSTSSALPRTSVRAGPMWCCS